MVGGRGAGVAAVVGGDHQDVAGAKALQNFGEGPVEFGQRLRVAVHVVAVAVQHVEIDEVHKAQPVEPAPGQLDGPPDSLRVVPGPDGLRDALAGEDVVDFPDRNHVFPGL